MYYLVVAIIIILIGIFLLYRFYPKIDEFIKKHFIPSQNVIYIKKEMKDLDTSSNTELPKKEEEEEPLSQFTKISNQIVDILYLPVDLLYKSAISYGTPLFYNVSQSIVKNI